VRDVLGLRRTSCGGFGGCPWWGRCWWLLRGVGGGSGWPNNGWRSCQKNPSSRGEVLLRALLAQLEQNWVVFYGRYCKLSIA